MDRQLGTPAVKLEAYKYLFLISQLALHLFAVQE